MKKSLHVRIEKLVDDHIKASFKAKTFRHLLVYPDAIKHLAEKALGVDIEKLIDNSSNPPPFKFKEYDSLLISADTFHTLNTIKVTVENK